MESKLFVGLIHAYDNEFNKLKTMALSLSQKKRNYYNKCQIMF